MSRPNVQMDPEDAHIIASLANHMNTILESFRDFGQIEPTWAVADDSPLNEERQQLHDQFGPSGVWASDTADYAADAALLFLMAQSDHLEVLHQLYDSATGLMFGVGPPSRSLLEISGYVHWLLHPDIDHVRTRAARSLLAQLNDAKRQRSVAKALDAPAHHVTQVSENVKVVQGRILGDFYGSEIERGKSGNLILRGGGHPGPGEALRYLKVAGSEGWNSHGAYAFLSNASHPTLHIIIDTLQYDDGVPTRFGHPDTTLHYRLARMAMAGFLTTWQITAAYRGLDQELSKRLATAIDDLPSPETKTAK